jgi:hypothetical protein
LVSTGQIVAWGTNFWGQLNVPNLPPGITYVKAAIGEQHAVALRSDGSAVAWGAPGFGKTVIPALGPGLSYTAIAAGRLNTVLLRSDGVLVGLGSITAGLNAVPTSPIGVRYVAVAMGRLSAAALRDDGEIDCWGLSGNVDKPTLPRGVYYVDVAVGDRQVAARRSDGEIVAWGGDTAGVVLTVVPPLGAGESYTKVSAGELMTFGLVGAESTYTSFAGGCAGSMLPASLVPRDTPRLGQVFAVAITNCPDNVAVMAVGLTTSPAPLSLGSVGMPGCAAHIVPLVSELMLGANNRVEWSLPIPNAAALLSARYYNQAVVLDLSGPMPLGAVVSGAAVGVIGR